jgi:hypothetical protein
MFYTYSYQKKSSQTILIPIIPIDIDITKERKTTKKMDMLTRVQNPTRCSSCN